MPLTGCPDLCRMTSQNALLCLALQDKLQEAKGFVQDKAQEAKAKAGAS